MHAVVGDTIAVPGLHVGESGRLGEVVEVRGQDGRPPYLVRWEDGHQALCYPGPETRISHEGQLAAE
ncbi:MAG: putative signal-transduction protein with domain [Frankiales bacterium]|nr:putative signal-transduction protein with domain [Frankiales bacterium]